MWYILMYFVKNTFLYTRGQTCPNIIALLRLWMLIFTRVLVCYHPLSFDQYASSPAAAVFPLASPPPLQPSAVAPTPSPALMSIPSPGNILAAGSPTTLHVPSPGSFVPAPSPSSLGIHMPSPAASFISPQGRSLCDGSEKGWELSENPLISEFFSSKCIIHIHV